MDEELLELQRQFEFAQQAKSTVRLSDRNVVELVQKLQRLQVLEFHLLYTVSGKEFITPEHLRNEIVGEIKELRRVSLIDLASTLGVDLYHVEKQSQHVVSNDSSLMLINGEIISSSYWDTVAEEINEKLQECSQITIAEIAAQLQVGSELVVSFIEPRLGTLIKGRLEGGQLYTPAYVSRVNAMVRGAARGIFVPMNLSALWSSLQNLLQEVNEVGSVAVESSFFQSLFNGLVKEGDILGTLRAGVHWTPSVFAMAQREWVDSFFSQNTFISYEALQKLGIPHPIQFMQSRYPEGVPLVTIFAHPSIIGMLDASVEEAMERGSWINSISVLPASFGSQDASKILPLCPSVQTALKSNKALILGESYIFSTDFVKGLFDSIEKELDSLNLSNVAEITETSNSKLVGSKKKKGKASAEDIPDSAPSKPKKNQKKLKPSSSKPNPKNEDDQSHLISQEWISQKIISLNPDLDDQDDADTVLEPLSTHLRPLLVNSWKERRRAAYTENTQRMKKEHRKLDESFSKMQLYAKALDLFEDDQPTFLLLHKHLLRTTGAEITNSLTYIAKAGEIPLRPVTEALEGKRVEAFLEAVRDAAGEAGLVLKKLDKKSEKALLSCYRKDVEGQVGSEADLVLVLPKVVSLLYVQVFARALQAPGRAIHAAVSRLKGKMDEGAFKVVSDYQSLTWSLLMLTNAAAGDEGDCSSDRIMSKREALESLMPKLKGLVATPQQA